MSKERTTADVLVELLPLLPLVRVVARWVFAGMALAALANEWRPSTAAKLAREYADELIAELEKRNGGAS